MYQGPSISTHPPASILPVVGHEHRVSRLLCVRLAVLASCNSPQNRKPCKQYGVGFRFRNCAHRRCLRNGKHVGVAGAGIKRLQVETCICCAADSQGSGKVKIAGTAGIEGGRLIHRRRIKGKTAKGRRVETGEYNAVPRCVRRLRDAEMDARKSNDVVNPAANVPGSPITACLIWMPTKRVR